MGETEKVLTQRGVNYIWETIKNKLTMASSVSAIDNQGVDIKTAAGTGTFIVYDAAGAVLVNLKIFGRSEQGENPSPENPKEIRSVGELGNLDVAVTGKNLLNKETASPNDINSVRIIQTERGIRVTNSISRSYACAAVKVRLKPNTSYTLSADIIATKSRTNVGIRKSTDGGASYNSMLICSVGSVTSPESDLSVTFTTDENEFYAVCMFCTYGIAEIGETTFENLQLEEGDIRTNFNPYHEPQTITIPLTEPLKGIGNYRDRLIYKGGVWGIEKNASEIVLNGSADEEWNEIAIQSTDKYFYTYHLPESEMANASQPTALCSHFKLMNPGDAVKMNCGFYIPSNRWIQLYFDGRPINEFLKWLQKNPITLVYQNTVPTWKTLPVDIQASLNAISTYQGKTTIMVSAGGVEVDAVVQYYAQPGNGTTVQSMLDSLSSKVIDDLVSNTAFAEKLTGYILKSQLIDNLLATEEGNPLDATQGKALKDMVDNTNKNLLKEFIPITASPDFAISRNKTYVEDGKIYFDVDISPKNDWRAATLKIGTSSRKITMTRSVLARTSTNYLMAGWMQADGEIWLSNKTGAVIKSSDIVSLIGVIANI